MPPRRRGGLTRTSLESATCMWDITIWGGEGGGARQVLSTSTRRLSSSCTAILSSRHDGADLSGLLVRAADYGLLEILVPLLLGARVPLIIHRAGLAAIARPEDEAEDHDSADDGTCASERRVLVRIPPTTRGRVARDARRSRSAITRSTRCAAARFARRDATRSRASDLTRSLPVSLRYRSWKVSACSLIKLVGRRAYPPLRP